MKQLMKVALMLVLLVSMLGAGLKADAAVKPGTPEKVEKKPYEYEFVVTDKEYNGFKGAKKLVITFDKAPTNTMINSNVYVEQVLPTGNIELPIVKSTSTVENKVTVEFDNLEYVDHINKQDLQLVIKKGSLYFDQITDYVLPFKFYDLTPGFESVFVKGDQDTINNKVFKHNEPRKILIQVPPLYITKIETIHRYNGLTDVKAPNLSNIDVIADPSAARLKVLFGQETNNESKYARDLDRSTAGVNGFSMGQAGIANLTCTEKEKEEDLENGKNCSNSDNEQFQLTAYNAEGRKLETRNFKMRVNNRENDFKINDYIAADSKQFGKPISLYDLMAMPTTLEKVMAGTQLSALDKLGVTYSVGSSIEVENATQLQMAISNENFRTIILKENIDLAELPENKLLLARNVVIKSIDKTNIKEITGDITLGNGKDQFIRLQDIKINGGLNVDVGSKGTVVLDNVEAINTPGSGPATTIISGGSDSVHLNDFTSTGGIEVSNTSKLRIVTTSSSGLEGNVSPLEFKYKAKALVRLEVISGKVKLHSDESLTSVNAFTVVANEGKANVETIGEIKGQYYFYNSQSLDDDEMTSVNRIEVVKKVLPLVFFNENTPVELTIENIEKQIVKNAGEEKEYDSWKYLKASYGWEIEPYEKGFIIKKAKVGEQGTILFEAKDKMGTTYNMLLEVVIQS